MNTSSDAKERQIARVVKMLGSNKRYYIGYSNNWCNIYHITLVIGV